MPRAAAAVLAVLLASAPVTARGRGRGAPGLVLLGAEQVRVRWTDGDTFRILSGRHRGRAARVRSVNTLETFGPVHRIGTAGGRALLAVARRSAAVAARAGGRCHTEGVADRYHRLLVTCPRAAEALVRSGHAMVFAIESPADPRLLALQRAAQRARRGIWAGGAPRLVPASLHSSDEPDLAGRGAYDRVVDTRTGAAMARPHGRAYRVCEEVCLGDRADRACMTYVPFARRYREKPACLR